MNISEISKIAQRIKNNIASVIVGSEKTIDLMLAALFCKGHVLLEDVPGTGKTLLSKTLAKSLGCEFSRIQFTPDLLPFDITGMSIFNQSKNEFEFVQGPVFTNILLADEINRATPRTQSALLECMQEKQVTMDNVTYNLEEPFIVLATQNPIDTSGTFALPEAQLDRFIIKTKMGYPDKSNAKKIIDRFINDSPLDDLKSVASKQEMVNAQEAVKNVEVSEAVREYMVDIVEMTREIDGVMLGVSPRGLLAMLVMCQAVAAIKGRGFVIPDDVKEIAVPVLSHRIICTTGYGGNSDMNQKVVLQALKKVPAPTENRD